MPHVGAKEGHELLAGDNRNVCARYAGRTGNDAIAELASPTNGMPNPDLTDLDARGELRDWVLGAPERPDGWNAYGRQLTRVLSSGAHAPLRGTEPQKQNTAGRLPFSRYFFQLDGPLAPGGPIPDPAARARIAGPQEAPKVKVVPKGGAVGYRAADYWDSFAWIYGDDPERSNLLTPAAPFVRVTIGQGQTTETTLPTKPADATGVALLRSLPNGPKDSARVQRRLDLRGKRPKTHPLYGPYRKDALVVHEGSPNRTEIGAFGQHPAPRVFRSRSFGTLQEMDVELGYRLKGPGGPSASQRMALEKVNGRAEREAVAWEPRGSAVPDGADGWSPEFVGAVGELYRLPTENGGEWWPIGRHAEILTNDPAKWPEGQPRPVRVERSRRDASGAPAPKNPLDAPEVKGAIEAPPGRYAFYTTNELAGSLHGPDEESAPSPPRVVTLRDSGLAAGGAASGVTDQAARVYGPSPQMIANARLTDYGNDGLDLDWDSPNVPGVRLEPVEGGFSVDDTSADTDVDVVKTSDYFEVNPSARHTARWRWAFSRRISGTADAVVRYFAEASDLDGNPVPGSAVGTVLPLASATGTAWARPTFGAPGTAAPAPAGARFARILFRDVGASGAGNARDLAYTVTHIGAWKGAAPRKRYPLALGLSSRGSEGRPAPPQEDPAHPYPPGPFCHVVEDPEDGAPGIPGGYVEYWAPPGTPPSPENFMRGMRKPVGPNEDRVLSAHVGCEEVNDFPALLLPTVVKDAAGKVLLKNPPLATLSGDVVWMRRHLAYRTPPNVAYLEFVGGSVGDGLIRAIGFQDERDPGNGLPTPFTNAHPLSGFLTVALDTDVPGKPVALAPRKTAAWIRAGAVITHASDDAGNRVTAAVLSYRAADAAAGLNAAPWRPSLAAVLANGGTRRFLEVRVELSTTDATKSPEVREIFLDLKREDPVLLRPDGSEFLGGARVDNLGVPQRQDGVILREYADGSRGREALGERPPRVLKGFTIECFTDEAAEESRELQRGESGDPVIEDWYRRYGVAFFGADLDPDLSGYMPTQENGRDGYWRHTAEVEEAELTAEEPI